MSLIKAENIIIGFGFSAIPLVREFDQSGEDYLIISGKDSVWRAMNAKDRLDFDLVSSRNTSFYSFDLVNETSKDSFPTASEFYEYQINYQQKYEDKIIDDLVEYIENYEDHSLIYTNSGTIYHATNLVIATGYKRNITKDILDFDTNISNKTIVSTSIGDTVNMIISKLIANNNKIIILQNGFFPTDKMIALGSSVMTLDQLEYHNIGFHFRKMYADTIQGNFAGALTMMPADIYQTYIKELLHKNINISTFGRLMGMVDMAFTGLNMLLSRIFQRGLFMTKYNSARHVEMDSVPSMPIPNGEILVKYWPIDCYHDSFADDLEGNIEKGHLLNDLPFFIDQGLVELVPKRHTIIDKDNKTINYKGDVTEFDYLIEGGPESPRMPLIKIRHSEKNEDYTYVYKDNFMGVIPKKLKNIYFMGLSRPMSGGIANINEMQSLLILKMLTDSAFNQEIYQSLEDKIQEYAKKYFLTKKTQKTDHLVYYGFYTEEVARLLDINFKLRDCRSFKDLKHYFICPNNTFKYRASGAYKVEGCQELIDRSYTDSDNYNPGLFYLLSYLMYRILFFVATILLVTEAYLPWWGGALLLGFQLYNSSIFMLFSQYYHSRIKCVYLLAFTAILPFIGVKYLVPFMVLDIALTFIKRKLGFRTVFNDLKHRERYKDFFFEKYLPTFKSLLAKKYT